MLAIAEHAASTQRYEQLNKMKIENFDPISPPSLTTSEDKITLAFNSLPPTGYPPNPLYKRLEVLIGNRIGYQFKIKKSLDNLEYVIDTSHSKAISIIYSLLSEFHTDPTKTRYNGTDSFISAKEVSSIVRDRLVEKFENFKIKNKALKKFAIQAEDYKLSIEWFYWHGDASKELVFSWKLSSNQLTALHNSILSDLDKPTVKDFNVLSINQWYDKSVLQERKYDIANSEEAVKITDHYIGYIDIEIMNDLRNGISPKYIIQKIRERVKQGKERFPERAAYILGLLSYQDGNENTLQELNKINLEDIRYRSYVELIKALKQKVKSS